MEKRKRKINAAQQVEFTAPFPLEETQERLYNLVDQRLVLGHPKFYLQGYEGNINVEDAPIDADTVEFRISIKRYVLDVKIVGFMKRLTKLETFVAGEIQIGILNYVTQLVILLFAIFVLTRSPINHSFIFIVWLGFLGWFCWRMTRRYANKLACIFEDTLIDNIQPKERHEKEKRKP